MVAIVTGSRLGLEQTSAWVLGSRGQIGQSSFGRGGENVFVNAATGNLIVTNQDEFLIGQGPDNAISRAYNSQGALDGDTNDGWRMGVSNVQGLNGGVNVAGSYLFRRDRDGSLVSYHYDTARGLYLSKEGAGAYDTISYEYDAVQGGNAWMWQDGDTGLKEFYNVAHNKIQRSVDRDGNSLTFTYTGAGLVSRITTQDGAYTDFTWSGSNLTQLVSTYRDPNAPANWLTQTRTRYAYDGQNRLASVTVDLTPTDNTIADGRTYVTTYTYDGTSMRVKTISQTDGSRIEIDYETTGAYRVTEIRQIVAEGVTRKTRFDYDYTASRITRITDASDQVTLLEHDVAGQLIKITEPAATAGGAAQVREFTYDSDGNVLRILTSPTTWTDFVYDDADGVGATTDRNGLWTKQYVRQGTGGYLAAARTYNARNALLTDTRYQTLDADGNEAAQQASGALTTRYVYDSENHLRYVLSPTGNVSKFDYAPNGNLIRTTAYTAVSYDVSSLAANASVTELAMNDWVTNLTDKTAAQITETVYDDLRGTVAQTIAYSTVLSSGSADGGSPATRTNYVYDQSGKLLSRYITGLSGTETFIYDGLGRMVSAVDFNGSATTTAFYDALGTTVVRLANGLNQVSVYNKAGEVVSYNENERGANLVNLQGWPEYDPNLPAGPADQASWHNWYTAETRWQTTMGPDGQPVTAMQAGQLSTDQIGGGSATNPVTIDPSKTYEFVFYFKKSDLTKHHLYFGLSSTNPANPYVEYATNGNGEGNPYFFAVGPVDQQALFQQDKWYKVVGYVLPQGSANILNGQMGGVYDVESGQKIHNVENFRWSGSRPNNEVYSRFFNYYGETSAGFSTYFYKPEIREFSADLISELLLATGSQYRYDAMGRLRVEVDPNGTRTHHLYDRVGRKVAEVDADGSLVEYKYDLADRLVATVRYATRLTSTQIDSLSDAAGNPTGVELPAVRPSGTTDDAWSWNIYDDAGRLLQTVDGAGGTTAYIYDGASRLLSQVRYANLLNVSTFKTTLPTTVTTPTLSTSGDRVTRYFYDTDGRQIGALNAEGYFSRIVYDKAGRVIRTDAFAEKIPDTATTLLATGTFDDLLAEVQSPTNGNDIVSWSVYDGRGFLRGTVGGEGEVTLFDYTPLGHLSQVVRGRKMASVPTTQPTLAQLAAASAAPVIETVNYTRNHYGQVLTEARVLATGTETVTYVYDSLRKLISSSTDRVTGTDYGSRQRYDRRGRVIGQLGGEGTAALIALVAPTRADIDALYRQYGVTFTYDDADRLIARTDANGVNAAGHRTLYLYDADGNLAYQANADGEVVGYAYDALNRLTATIAYAERVPTAVLAGFTGGVIPPLNGGYSRTAPPTTASVTMIVYNVTDTIKETEQQLTATETVKTLYAYNAFGELTTRTDPLGTAAAPLTRATTFAYDRRGLTTQTIQDSGGFNLTTTAVYDAFGRALTVTDPRSAPRHTSYDRAGRVLVRTDANTKQTTYTYDARSNVLTVKDRNNKTTTFTHDAFSRTVTMTSAELVVTTTTHDDQGHTLVFTDGAARKLTYAYDLDGALKTVTDDLGNQVSQTYNTAGQLYETIDGGGVKIRFSYDAAGRVLTETVDPTGLNLATTYAYDAKGQRILVTDPSGVRTGYTFDLAGRTTEIIADPIDGSHPAGLNLRTVYTLDRAGNVIKLTEAFGKAEARETSYVYDKLDRLISQQTGPAGLNVRSEYSYDANGNATRRRDQVTAGQFVETHFVYDAENRLILTVDPAGGVTRTAYDNEGRVVRSLAYLDALSASEKAGLSAAPTAAAVEALVTANATHDRSNAFVYDDDGRLVFSLDAIGALSENVYDGAGNVVRQIRYATAYTASQTPTELELQTWAAANGADARVTRAVYDDANRQAYGIDAEGFVIAIVQDGAGRTLRTIRYAADSDPAALGLTPTKLQLDAWVAANAQAAADQKTHFVYDAAGRAAFVADAAGHVSRTTYDAAGRVTAQERFGPVFSVADGSSHATLTALVAAHVTTAARTSYVYDGAGRRVSVTDALNGVTTTELNGLGKAVKVTDQRGSVGYFYYDGAGRLTLQVDPEKYWTQTTYWAGEEVASVKRGVLRVTETLVVGTAPTLPTHADDATTAFARDNAGRVTGVTDAENFAETYLLNAFGDRTRVTNRLNGATNYTYDRRGLKLSELLPVTSVQNGGAVGNVINLFEYDAHGNLTKTTEAATLGEARTTNYAYDKLNRLVQTTRDAVTVTSSVNFATSSVTPTETIVYDGLGNVIETVNAGGARTLFYYDVLNRKVAEIDAAGTLRTWTYDARNNATVARAYDTAVTLPATPGGTVPTATGAYRETLYTFDLNNRLTHTTTATLRTGEFGTGFTTALAPIVTENRYDAAGNVVQVIDGRGESAAAFYDALGRQIATVDAEGYLTTFVRDAEGNVTQEVRYAIKVVGAVITTPARVASTLAPRTATASLGDRITDFTYDRNGRRETETRRGVQIYSAGGTDRLTTADAQIVYEYDGLGNVTKKTEANGDYVEYAHDLLGRQIAATQSTFVDFQGQTVRRRTATTYNGWSAVTKIEDGEEGAPAAQNRVTFFSYGTGGRLGAITEATGFIRYFGYDAMGRVTKESYDRMQANDAAVTEGRRYGYDILGRLTSESAASTNGTWSFGDTRSSTYNAHGEVTDKRLNNVVQETFDYDAGGRVWRSTGGDGVAKYFMYDKAGRMTLAVTPQGGMANYSDIETLVTYLTSGGQAIGAQAKADLTLTFSLYDKRGQVTGTREPHRQLARDLSTLAYTTTEIIRGRTYNAFGEVTSETDARGFTTDFTYNTMGRIIEQIRPEVAFTNEQGVVANARPTEQRRFDISGRLVATRNSNGFWTTRTLLAGSGHDGQEAVTINQVSPDQGVLAWGVDVFGDIRKVTDQMGAITLNTYDKASRLISVQHPGRAANSLGNPTGSLVQLTDNYAYDGLGQRIHHWNSQHGSSIIERTMYDREGRVLSQTDFEGRATTYAWVWDATLQTVGLGTFGGWIKTTTHASAKVGVERLDSFGRLVGKTDLGTRNYAMGFDQTGRMVTQTSGAADSTATTGAQSLIWSWYNTGTLAQQKDVAGNALGYSTSNTQGNFNYDAAGNRVSERYATTEWTYAYNPDDAWNPYDPYTPPSSVQTTTLRQDGRATYDALGRMTEFKDLVISTTDPTMTQYTYDLNGNVRSTFAKYWTAVGATSTVSGTQWYKYDAMDRFVVAQGTLDAGVITGGTQLMYDAAGNRRQLVAAMQVETDVVAYEGWEFDPNSGVSQEYWDGEGDPPPGYVWKVHYEFVDGTRIEHYDYTPDGYLAQVSMSKGVWNTVTNAVDQGAVAIYAKDQRDAMGRLVSHKEYAQGGSLVTHERTATYDKAGLLLSEVNLTFTDIPGGTGQDYYTTVTTNYDYNAETSAGSNVFTGQFLGTVTRVRTTATKDMAPLGGSVTNLAATQTTYGYTWWDDARQALIKYDGDTSTSANTVYTSTFAYDVNGKLTYVNIKDGRARNVTFVTDINGQVLDRKEADNNTALDDPWDRYFYFNGVRVGEITNNAGFVPGTYVTAVNARTAKPSTGPSTPFLTGNTGSFDADFDQAYEALTPGSVRGSGSAWTVRDGDTLQGMAAAIWGDASLWYLIADANGLTSASLLSAGQTLVIPAKAGNVHNTAETFRPYDPNKAIGDVNPTQPKPPAKAGGCGVVGQILMVVIAAVVVALIMPYAAAGLSNAMASLGGAAFTTGGAAGGAAFATGAGAAASWSVAGTIAGGAVAGAAGSIVSQAFGVATGNLEKFDWKAVGLAALSGGVGAGMNFAPLIGAGSAGMGGMVGASLRGAASSIVTQGVAVATGLQEKFSWTSVAVSAVMAAVGSGLTSEMGLSTDPSQWKMADYGKAALVNTASAAAGAATMSAIDGTSFGDNLMAVLPQAIGQTIGQMVAGGIQAHSEAARVRSLRHAGVERSTDRFRQMFPDTPEVVEAYGAAAHAAADDPDNPEARANMDRTARAVLEANPDHPAVIDFFQGIDQSRRIDSNSVAGSDYSSGPDTVGDPQAVEIDEVVVTGSRDYLLGSTIDRAGIWVGQVKSDVGQAVGQYIEENPGVGIALTLADGAFAVVAPAKYLGGAILNHFEEQASGFIADQMDGPDMWARDLAEDGGSGFVFAASIALGGLAALRVRVDPNGLGSNGGNLRVRGNPLRARIDNLTGVARDARWVSPRRDAPRMGLRRHAADHAEEMGLSSRAEYDLSARETIQNGRSFTYRDRGTGENRVGYFHEGRFTATSQTRAVPAILSHYAMSWAQVQALPGFANR